MSKNMNIFLTKKMLINFSLNFCELCFSRLILAAHFDKLKKESPVQILTAVYFTTLSYHAPKTQ